MARRGWAGRGRHGKAWQGAARRGAAGAAAFANLFRCKLLLERGGWWVDLDIVCLRRFDFPEPIVVASERARPGTSRATDVVLKFPTGHAAIQQCYEAARREDQARLTWGKTGPLLLDRIVREYGLQPFVKPPEVFCPLNYWDWKMLLAEGSNPPKPAFTNESYAIHLWHEMWRRAGIELDSATGEIRSTRLFQKLWQSLARKSSFARDGATPIAGLLRKYGLKK